MTTLAQQTADVKKPEWITVNVPFAWGLEDSMTGLSSNEGYQFFVGANLTDYLHGWRAGLTIRIWRVFGWEDAAEVNPDVRRQAILAAAKSARDYITARTAQDAAFYFDRELYASWPGQYRAERFAHEYMSNRVPPSARGRGAPGRTEQSCENSRMQN